MTAKSGFISAAVFAFGFGLMAATPGAMAATVDGDAPFCAQKPNSENWDCSYQTKADCDKAAQAQGGTCQPRAMLPEPK